jgi:hypothetical protein
VVINTDLVRAVFWDEPTRSCARVFDDKYAVSVSGTLKEVEGKLKGTLTTTPANQHNWLRKHGLEAASPRGSA